MQKCREIYLKSKSDKNSLAFEMFFEMEEDKMGGFKMETYVPMEYIVNEELIVTV